MKRLTFPGKQTDPNEKMDKPSSLGAFPSHLGPASRGPIPGNQPQA